MTQAHDCYPSPQRIGKEDRRKPLRISTRIGTLPPGVILDYDAAGSLVSLEILDASRRVTEAGRVEYQTTG